jgi:general secretion pathway protein L
LSVTIAATARTLIAPIVEAISDLHPDSIALSTTSEEAAGQPKRIDIFNQRTAHEHGIRRIRRWLLVIAAAAGLAAFAATAAWLIAGEKLDSEQAALAQRLAERRAAVNDSHATAADDAVEFLERKKRENPPGVMVLETLSQILPNDTYLTELHMEGGKIQISGLTHDAPALIRLIEQSQYFAQATFFAPTTRSPDQREERFHIEAQTKPLFGAP